MLIGDPNVGMMGSGGSSVNAVHLNGGYGNFVSPAVYGDYTWTDSPTGICKQHGLTQIQ